MSALAGDLRFISLAVAVSAFVMLLVAHAMLAVLLASATAAGGFSGSALAGAALYDLIFFNCTAYAYFHVFNLSETGRRIRILLELLDGVTPDTAYAAQDMVRQRLGRLLLMGQVRLEQGRFVLASRKLLNIARLIRFIGRFCTGINRTRHVG